jgi:2-polyprenyl-3-methyl-5-hydroxy-6-metoxy-1,4-benzoquinol methylase
MTLGLATTDRYRVRYDEVSPLRQALDIEPVLAMVPSSARDLLDIGCGTGDLLERAAAQLKGLKRLVGIDLSDERVAIARTKLAGKPIRSEFHAADLRLGTPPVGPFDCIVMTSVLHWLHPVEAEVFRAIGRHARPKGVFVLSTYHPLIADSGLGGTDDVVHAALLRLGWSRDEAAAFFDRPDALPISKRTRSKREIKDALSPNFEIDRVVDRSAVMRVDGADQYLKYHSATFGGYYSGRLDADIREAFFDALGEEAMTRMADRGHVTEMPVRIWRTVNAQDKRIDVV